MNKPTLIYMCGLPASGKSTNSKRLSKEYDATIFSSDELRVEMFGDIHNRDRNPELFTELHRRIKECLKSGKSAIYDATNVNSKRRGSFLQELSKIDCHKLGVIVATPYEECLKNNATRDRHVPEEVIETMYRNWNTPYWFEGFDDIRIEWNKPTYRTKDVDEWLSEFENYEQDNYNHSLTLGKHCEITRDELEDCDDKALVFAGALHDCGKPFTKTFVNSKGETTDVAHYYSHENVGAYEGLLYNYGDVNPLDVSILINLHMKPYAWERDGNEKLHNKFKKLWGDDLYGKVVRLHEADKVAH